MLTLGSVWVGRKKIMTFRAGDILTVFSFISWFSSELVSGNFDEFELTFTYPT